MFRKIREKIEEKAFSIQLKQGIKEPSTFDAMAEKFSVGEIKDIINQVEAEYNQTVTNADIIRHMTDEELADFLFEVEYRRSVFGNGAKWKSEEDALKYLQEEVER